jgi:hypothetical protein
MCHADLGAAKVGPADVVSTIPSQTAGRIASEAFCDCLTAEMGHADARWK